MLHEARSRWLVTSIRPSPTKEFLIKPRGVARVSVWKCKVVCKTYSHGRAEAHKALRVGFNAPYIERAG